MVIKGPTSTTHIRRKSQESLCVEEVVQKKIKTHARETISIVSHNGPLEDAKEHSAIKDK